MLLPIPYGRQEITAEDEQAVLNVLRSDYLTQGPAVSDFEKSFSDYIGAKHSIAVSNGTAALHLACLVLGIPKGKKVITTPITFAASANAVLYCGGEVEFVDIDKETYCLDLRLVEEKLKADPEAYCGIISVDFAGHPSALSELRKIADKFGVWIIEDACHAPGATYTNDGKIFKCGSGIHADVAIFSFHPVKHIATGEGGMLTTQSDDLANKLKILRTHGIVKDHSLLKENHGGWYNEMQFLGYNYRIADISCALGISQLRRASSNLNKRQYIADYYNKNLTSKLIKPFVAPENLHAYHLYVIKTERRKELYDYLKEHQILSQVHYLPVYKHPYWKKLKNWEPCVEAEKFYLECLSLPIYPSLTGDQLKYIADTINHFFEG